MRVVFTNLHPFQWMRYVHARNCPTKSVVCIIYWRSNKQNHSDAVNICRLLHTLDGLWAGYINGSAIYWQLIDCRLQGVPDNWIAMIRSFCEHAVDDEQRWISGSSDYINIENSSCSFSLSTPTDIGDSIVLFEYFPRHSCRLYTVPLWIRNSVPICTLQYRTVYSR